MTDRELLELAAKAAGYDISQTSDMIWDDKTAEYVAWNPLTDDGDALRLAVKLVKRQGEMLLAWVNGSVDFGDTVMCYSSFLFEDDIGEATRRAIVNAAAEIGKEMK